MRRGQSKQKRRRVRAAGDHLAEARRRGELRIEVDRIVVTRGL
jgi:hypothetical protein